MAKQHQPQYSIVFDHRVSNRNKYYGNASGYVRTPQGTYTLRNDLIQNFGFARYANSIQGSGQVANCIFKSDGDSTVTLQLCVNVVEGAEILLDYHVVVNKDGKRKDVCCECFFL